MSTYIGLYVQRDNAGRILTVQAMDAAGSSYALQPSTYMSRGGTPDIETLPDLATYQFTEEFKRVGSQGDLNSFATKYSLVERSAGGSKNVYAGIVNGRLTELRERWWDPSSVYAAQKDEHEVILVIADAEMARVCFTGGS